MCEKMIMPEHTRQNKADIRVAKHRLAHPSRAFWIEPLDKKKIRVSPILYEGHSMEDMYI